MLSNTPGYRRNLNAEVLVPVPLYLPLPLTPRGENAQSRTTLYALRATEALPRSYTSNQTPSIYS